METDGGIRLDLLVARARNCSRSYAATLIAGGYVKADGKLLLKPGERFANTPELVITAPETEYVSRGGYKLERALRHFGVSVENSICMDIGASTGGFTDCLLQRGAKLVYAVDVGSAQLSEKLLSDTRVVSLPNTNIRYLNPGDIGLLCDFICIDVSFISITKVADNARKFLSEHGEMVCLIKPQFEAGPGALNKKGLVRDKKTHIKILINVYQFFNGINHNVAGIITSPVKGGDGNTEYLIFLSSARSGMTQPDYMENIVDMVNKERL